MSEGQRGEEPLVLSALERGQIYREQVQANIEAEVLLMIRQVVKGEVPYLIQARVDRPPIPTKPNPTPKPYNDTGDVDPENRENQEPGPSGGGLPGGTGTPSTVMTQGKRIRNGDQVLPTLQTDFMYVRFGAKSSMRKYALMFHLMAKVYGMTGKGVGGFTVRDLYYEDVALYEKQSMLERALVDLCHVLRVPRNALGVEATSKGLMAGDLRLKTSAGALIDLAHFRTGMLVPSNSFIDDIIDIQSNARQIVLVEKDAIFQRLIGEKIFEDIGPTIFITGKGYPDLITLKMMRKLKDTLNLKVFALVDCDPYGIEIAAVIRWGSYAQASIAKCANDPSISEELMIPDLIWLGLLPSDVAELALTYRASTVMSVRDLRKLESVKKRISTKNESFWEHEIGLLESSLVKVELEALFVHPRFANFYLKQKLNAFYRGA